MSEKREVNLVDHGFMDARSKVLDVAAFLDRVERHGQTEDYRVAALRKAIEVLSSEGEGRAKRVLTVLSDPTEDPIPAAVIQGAFGAYREPEGGEA